MSDDFGDRMKLYEGAEAQRRFMPLLPILARLDGRNFSAFTRGLPRPFDARLSECMRLLTIALVNETGARVGYTQSDEITLAIYSDTFGSQVYFDGRIQKIVSSLAAYASVVFLAHVRELIPERSAARPTFDCRAWTVPNLIEATNAILWREQDATKNSISMAASVHYSHRELHGLDSSAKQELLHRKGINWNDYPAHFKRGSYVLRRTTTEKFTPEEIDALPPMHHARTNPDAIIERSRVCVVDLPPLAGIANRVDVLFHGASPERAA